ncbi:hypothetical protein MMC29_003784 [Sticta canariensis]|nr:hypothetical protein [Sticta canariensis]
MTDKRLPEEDLLRERRYRPNHEDGWQRPAIHQAPQIPPRTQLQNHEKHLNHRDFPDQAPNFPVHNIPYRPNLPDRGQHVDYYDVHYHEPHQPYHLQPDHRLPTAGNYPSTPISLISADHYATHFFLLVPPSSHLLSTLLAEAKKARVTTSHIPAEDVIERALENRTLTHISNGPSGGIWVVAAEKPDVVACLLAEMQGGWELLGVGKGGNEGMTFLRHPCGFGTEQEVEKKQKKKKKKKKKEDYKTERANVEKIRRNKERGGDERRA